MDPKLQAIMITASILFTVFVVLMVRNKKIELRYTLTWLLAAAAFIVFSVFPDVLKAISSVLSIKEPVNTLFLSIIFFMLLIIFTLTLALSRNAGKVKTLSQEIGIIKLEIERLKNGR